MSKDERAGKISLAAKLAYVSTGVVVGLAAAPIVRKAVASSRPKWSGLAQDLANKAERFADLASDFLVRAREDLIRAEQEWQARAAAQAASDASAEATRFEYDESSVVFDDVSVSDFYDPTEMAPPVAAAASAAGRRKGASGPAKPAAKARAAGASGPSKERTPKRKVATRRRSKDTVLN